MQGVDRAHVEEIPKNSQSSGDKLVAETGINVEADSGFIFLSYLVFEVKVDIGNHWNSENIIEYANESITEIQINSLALGRRFALPIIIMFGMYRLGGYGWEEIKIAPYKAATVKGNLVRWQIRPLSSAASSMS